MKYFLIITFGDGEMFLNECKTIEEVNEIIKDYKNINCTYTLIKGVVINEN